MGIELIYEYELHLETTTVLTIYLAKVLLQRKHRQWLAQKTCERKWNNKKLTHIKVWEC